ncbi:MAG: hypothetical protein DRI70_03665 [Bacteroidetes bacterium]|nr:MAG: hypothetical protein DRI70_03665 [Bacteroidota bacterium]
MKLNSPTFFIVFISYFILLATQSLSAQVGVNTVTPGDGSILDVDSTEKGLLIPRVSIADLSTIAPITVSSAGEESLMVYNTNVTTGKGFYYWDSTDWIAITFKDGDFHKVGTSSPPTDITDDVFRTGDVGIGQTSPSYALDVRSDTDDRVLNIVRGGSLAGTNYGIYLNNFNSGLGAHTGVRSNVSYSGALGTQRHYGFYSQVYGSVGNTNHNIGIYNALRNGTGTHTAVFNSMSGSEDSDNIGTGNYISNSGDGEHRGNSNSLTGTGSGNKFGNYTNITSGTGDNYGSYNDLNNTASGKSAYGTWNDINSSNGTNYAGWFDSYGIGATYYAAVFNRGHVVANESGLNNDFRIEGQNENNLFFVDASADMIGIGNSSPGKTLDVTGDIRFSGSMFQGGSTIHPDYVFETYFDGFSEYNKEYSLMSLEQIENFIKVNKHLPNIQSREDVLKNDWDVS